MASSTFRQMGGDFQANEGKQQQGEEPPCKAERRPPFSAGPGASRGSRDPHEFPGTYALLEGSASGTDSDIVATTAAWTAAVNNPSTTTWLHTTSTGTGTGLATFTFDANSEPRAPAP